MNNKHKEPADVEQFVFAVAKHRHWQSNPNKDFTQLIINGLRVNYNRYGYFQCPCRDGDGDKLLDEDIICPCVYAQADIEQHGHCFCGLFMTKTKAEEIEAGTSLKDIPERRELEKRES